MKLFYNKPSGLRFFYSIFLAAFSKLVIISYVIISNYKLNLTNFVWVLQTYFVRQCIITLKELQLNPVWILTLEVNVFGDVLVVLRDVQISSISFVYYCGFRKAVDDYLNYLTGELADPTEVMMQ